MKIHSVLRRMLVLCIVFLLASPLSLSAQEDQDDYSRAQLTQMLAPIALYSDDLLSQVLMAATYPLEIVAADRWVKKNPLLTGDNLDKALRNQDWDSSVKALCHVPTVLALMSDRLDETTNLGNAFLAQEDEVMDVIQELRVRAYREGNLRSNSRQKVTHKSDGTIVIEPADPRTVYVPYYNPLYVYGPWWYPALLPWYWGPADIVVGNGIFFWPHFYVGFSFGFGYWCNIDWPSRIIIIDVHRPPLFLRSDYDWNSRSGRWHHDLHHRRGVVYRDRATAKRFNQFRETSRVFDRKVRGFPEADLPGRTRPIKELRPPQRQQLKSRIKTRTIPGPPEPSRLERVPSRNVPTERERIRRQPERARDTIRQTERHRQQKKGTIFGQEDYGSEESRSSIRGKGSRKTMHQSGKGRDSSR